MKSQNAIRLERWRRQRGVKPRVRPIMERLIEKRRIDENGCWLWCGGLHKNGYASTTTGSRGSREYVHRISYRLHKKEIPEGKDIDHLCRVRHCFNPNHLEAVSRKENIERGVGPGLLGTINGTKTHCKNGHPFDAENTYFRPSGGRKCRECERQRRKQK